MAFVPSKSAQRHGVQDVTSEFKDVTSELKEVTSEFMKISCIACLSPSILDPLLFFLGVEKVSKIECNRMPFVP